MQHLGNRPKLMGRIIFRISMNIIIQTVMAIFLSKGDFFPQIMLVSTLTMHDFSQYPFLCHTINHHLVSAIDTVFHKHDGSLRLFIAIHQLPALRKGIGSPYLGGYRLSCPHSRHGYFTVGIPGGTNQDSIQFLHGKHFPIVGKGLRSFSSHLHKGIGHLLLPVPVNITKGNKIHIRMLGIHIFY